MFAPVRPLPSAPALPASSRMAQTDMATASDPSSANGVKKSAPAEKKYKCQYCNRAFSRSEHRSRHERSHVSRSTFFVTANVGQRRTPPTLTTPSIPILYIPRRKG